MPAGFVSMNLLLISPDNRDPKAIAAAAQGVRSLLETTLNLHGNMMTAEVADAGFLGVIPEKEFSDSAGAVSLVYSYASAPGFEDTLFSRFSPLYLNRRGTISDTISPAKARDFMPGGRSVGKPWSTVSGLIGLRPAGSRSGSLEVATLVFKEADLYAKVRNKPRQVVIL